MPRKRINPLQPDLSYINTKVKNEKSAIVRKRAWGLGIRRYHSNRKERDEFLKTVWGDKKDEYVKGLKREGYNMIDIDILARVEEKTNKSVVAYRSEHPEDKTINKIKIPSFLIGKEKGHKKKALIISFDYAEERIDAKAINSLQKGRLLKGLNTIKDTVDKKFDGKMDELIREIKKKSPEKLEEFYKKDRSKYETIFQWYHGDDDQVETAIDTWLEEIRKL